MVGFSDSDTESNASNLIIDETNDFETEIVDENPPSPVEPCPILHTDTKIDDASPVRHQALRSLESTVAKIQRPSKPRRSQIIDDDEIIVPSNGHQNKVSNGAHKIEEIVILSSGDDSDADIPDAAKSEVKKRPRSLSVTSGVLTKKRKTSADGSGMEIHHLTPQIIKSYHLFDV